MKFTVSQDSLADALSVVLKGAGGATTLPILNGVLIKAYDGVLELHTTNTEISIKHRITARVDEPGEAVVPCKLFSNITKALPDAPVSFEVVERQAVISCAKSSFRLNMLDPRDFPEFPAYAIESCVDLPVSVLSEMVSRVWRVASKDRSRGVLTGVLMTVENNTIRLVATDSYRLAVCDTQVETSNLEGSFEAIVPSESLNDALSVMGDAPTIMVGVTDAQVVFEAGNTCYVTRRMKESFPSYRMLIPSACAMTAKLDNASFAAAVKRVSAIGSGNPTLRFDIDTEAGVLKLTLISSDQGYASETLDIDAEGKSGCTGFSCHYIADFFNMAGHDKDLTLEIQDYGRPAVFKTYCKVNYLYLAMPIRLSE